jgi:H+-transporting ATPase
MSSTEASTNEKGNGGLSTRWDKDLEKGDKKDGQRSKSIASSGRRGSRRESVYPQDYDELDEYTALQKFIVTYRDPRAAMLDEAAAHKEGEDVKKGAPWWQFWRKGGSSNASPIDEGIIPPDWLDSDMHKGISEHDVEGRRKRTGFNELTTEKENMFLKFLTFFTGPILYVMELAAVLAAGLRDWVDFGVIVGILLLNAFVGWYQEKQAADVVASLKGDIAMKAIVIRDGSEQEIKARELVPGDIVILEEGQSVPADCRIMADYYHPETYETYLRMKEADRFGQSDDPEGPDDKDKDEDGEKEGDGPSSEDDLDDDGGAISAGPPIVAIDQSATTRPVASVARPTALSSRRQDTLSSVALLLSSRAPRIKVISRRS